MQRYVTVSSVVHPTSRDERGEEIYISVIKASEQQQSGVCVCACVYVKATNTYSCECFSCFTYRSWKREDWDTATFVPRASEGAVGYVCVRVELF